MGLFIFWRCAIKWFKHISDSLDDPKLFELMRLHKADGYLVFFGILEIYAREFKTDSGWMLHTSTHYLKTKLHIYHANRLSIILQSINDLFQWSVNLDGDNITIKIDKFRKYLDESTLKKLRQAEKKSGAVPESIPKKVATEVEVEVEVDKNKTKKKVSGCQYSETFLKFWNAYPKKKSKGQAWRAWMKSNGQMPDIDTLIKILDDMKQTKDWLKNGGDFIPYPATWINSVGWEDEIDGKLTKPTIGSEYK